MATMLRETPRQRYMHIVRITRTPHSAIAIDGEPEHRLDDCVCVCGNIFPSNHTQSSRISCSWCWVRRFTFSVILLCGDDDDEHHSLFATVSKTVHKDPTDPSYSVWPYFRHESFCVCPCDCVCVCIKSRWRNSSEKIWLIDIRQDGCVCATVFVIDKYEMRCACCACPNEIDAFRPHTLERTWNGTSLWRRQTAKRMLGRRLHEQDECEARSQLRRKSCQ